MTKAKAGQVAPRAVEAEPGHADHDQVRPVRLQGLVAQAELVEHPGRVVLDDHVAGGHDAVQQLDPPRVAQVEGQAPLVGVEGGEDRPPLPPLVLRRRDAADQADAVGPLRRLEVDHVRAEQRQQAAHQRPGPVRRHVEDPQPAERERTRPRSGAPPATGRWPRRWRARPAAAPGRVVGGPPSPTGTAARGSWPRRGGWRRRCPAPGGGRRSRRSRRWRSVRSGCGRPTPGPGPRPRCGRRSTRRWSGVSAVRSRKSFGSSVHSGWPTIMAEVEPLLAGAAPQPDQPVTRRTDAGRRDEAAAPHGAAELVVERDRVVGEAQDQRLEHRHVDQLALGAAPAPGRQRPDGGEGPGHPLPDLAADVDGRPVGAPPGQADDAPGPGLQGELGGRPVPPRAGQPEGRDGHDREVRVGPPELVGGERRVLAHG